MSPAYGSLRQFIRPRRRCFEREAARGLMQVRQNYPKNHKGDDDEIYDVCSRYGPLRATGKVAICSSPKLKADHPRVRIVFVGPHQEEHVVTSRREIPVGRGCDRQPAIPDRERQWDEDLACVETVRDAPKTNQRNFGDAPCVGRYHSEVLPIRELGGSRCDCGPRSLEEVWRREEFGAQLIGGTQDAPQYR